MARTSAASASSCPASRLLPSPTPGFDIQPHSEKAKEYAEAVKLAEEVLEDPTLAGAWPDTPHKLLDWQIRTVEEYGWLMRLTGERGVDLVYEHVGGELFQHGLDSLSKDGRLVTCGAHSGEVVPFDIIPFFRTQKSIICRSEISPLL